MSTDRSIHDDVEHPALAVPVMPLVLVLDLSETMAPHVDRMARYLDDGLRDAALNGQAAAGVVVATVVIRDDVAEVLEPHAPFTPLVDACVPTDLRAAGVTPLHDAVDLARELIDAEHARLEAAGRMRYLGNIVIVTDGDPTDAQGYPTDAWRAAAARVREAHDRGRILTTALGFGDADEEILRAFAPNSTRIGSLPELASIISSVTMSASNAGTAADQVAAAESALDLMLRVLGDPR